MKDKVQMIGKWQADAGFTLIEMIGVLAVIAILVALLLPKVFEIMAESKANSLVGAMRTYETAIIDYYADIGSIRPLIVAGSPATDLSGDSFVVRSLPARLTLDQSDPLNTGANSWSKFKGPYLSKFSSDSPPGLGTKMYMPARRPVVYGTATTASNRGWDFNNDGNSDIPTTASVVYVYFTGISNQDFENVDVILDPGMGATATERQLRGRVKYDTGTNEMMIYLTHQ
ncbi:type II secretion system protein [Candidatus Nitrospira salsa]